MGCVLEGEHGGILGLREFINGHEEAIVADLLDRGLHLYDLGDRLSWFEFKCWLKHLHDPSAVVRVRRERMAADSIPEDLRAIGSDPLPIDEMDAWLGWDQ
ncbi:hypothetical protein FG87_21735 [Nocardia vulneris]|uniref:Uncharacterized protein n=1 Tax=Nocardia vulneris TaxID=1141657 RepID=A0ABR4ZCF1_9NOCA|nr:hypothetical protein FG87_21735 [Nocardia vulneris]